MPIIKSRNPLFGSSGSYTDTTYLGRNPKTSVNRTASKPVMGSVKPIKVPDYKAPEYNKQRVRAYAQQQAGPQLRALREGVQRAIGQSYENPNQKAQATREALSGFGLGMGEVMSDAIQQGAQLYNTEYSAEVDEAQRQFEAEMAARQQEYDLMAALEKERYSSEYEKYMRDREEDEGKNRILPYGMRTYSGVSTGPQYRM